VTKSRRAFALDLSPLRSSRDFRRLVVGQGVSALGSFATMVALPYQVFHLTHSSFAVGMLGVVELVPLLGAALLGGAFADAHDRRTLLLLSEVALCLVSMALVVNALMPEASLALIYICAAISAAASGFHRPALEAMTPRLMPREQMPAVSAIRSALGTSAAIAGPALGGVLIASRGLAFTYAFDVVTFVVSLIAVSGIRRVPAAADAQKPSLAAITDGMKYARGRQELMGSYLIDFNAMLFGMPNALFPAIADRLGGGRVLGLLYAAPAVGAFIASAASGWTARVTRYGTAIILAAAAWGVAIIGFGLAVSVPLAIGCLVAAGFADMVSALFRMTLWNQTIPDNFRGRLAGIEQISYMSGPMLGNAEAGLVASATSVTFSVVSGGILCVIGSAALALVLPRFRMFDVRAFERDREAQA
jgi:MFS family permease